MVILNFPSNEFPNVKTLTGQRTQSSSKSIRCRKTEYPHKAHPHTPPAQYPHQIVNAPQKYNRSDRHDDAHTKFKYRI